MPKPHKYRVSPHSDVDLAQWPTAETDGYTSEDEAIADTRKHVARLAELQELLAADATQSLLIVLQGMDTAGKDGTISHIFTGVNPQGCDVAQFKQPTPEEKAHDFLWRIHAKAPAKGKITIFNRSHYEDVLVPVVHGGLKKKPLQQRYEQIVDFERMLFENGTVILKFFLHISHKEQTARLKARLQDKNKIWKLSQADLTERKFWKQYHAAYQQAIAATSRKHAPWFVLPADHKWYRNAVISKLLVHTLQSMKLAVPAATLDPQKVHI